MMSHYSIAALASFLLFSNPAYSQIQANEKLIFGRAFNHSATTIESTGKNPLLDDFNNGFQSLVFVGTSAYTYPFFLLRKGPNEAVEIVFFREDGKGTYTQARDFMETEAGVSFTIIRRGGGEAGQWKQTAAFKLKYLNTRDTLLVTITGNVVYTHLIIFHTKYEWKSNMEFSGADLNLEFLQEALEINTPFTYD